MLGSASFHFRSLESGMHSPASISKANAVSMLAPGTTAPKVRESRLLTFRPPPTVAWGIGEGG